MYEYRLSLGDLKQELETWAPKILEPLLLVACGGTALTLKGYKASTKDVDFLVPDPTDYDRILQLVKAMGYVDTTASGYKHPNGRWIFEFYEGQKVFQTDLLEPINTPENHHVIWTIGNLTVATLTTPDLIISKMFRGSDVDVQDSVIAITSEDVDLSALIQRYIDTAGYYYNPPACKQNLKYLVDALKEKDLMTNRIEEVINDWIP